MEGVVWCQGCRWWDGEAHDAYDLGLCRFNPPIPYPDGMSRWTQTAASDWCSKWESVE